MRFELITGLAIGLGHVNGHAPTHLLRIGSVTRLFAGFAKLREDTAKDVDVEIRHAHVAEAALGDEVDGFLAADAGNPNRRVRLLNRSRPWVYIAVVIMLRVPFERPRPR